jgi:hypothetical protein
VFRDKFGKSILVDRWSSAINRLDDIFVDVDIDDLVTEIRETGCDK